MDYKSATEFAFPHEQTHEQFQYSNTVHHGLTIRDYFAAKAMQAIIGSMKDTDNLVNGGYVPQCTENNLAYNAYSVADSMLKQRELCTK